MGHLGLTPQSIYKFGTYNVRAKEDSEAEQLIIDAQMLEKVGCFGIVFWKKIPANLAKKVAHMVNIPIIGIGAGAQVDGQVLVLNDILGMNKEFSPRFLRYLNLDDEITKAIKSYTNDIKKQDFPNDKEQY